MSNLPRISAPLKGGFLWFSRRYFRKHFHVLAVNRQLLDQVAISDADALVVYANHASWWDPISALLLGQTIFPQHAMYAPIDAVALRKYRMFSKLGFYGIEPSTRRGAADFLDTSLKILHRPASSIWLTPEGRFVDPRDENVRIAPGLAHLAHKISVAAESSPASHSHRTWFIPLAAEYTYWEERKPEALCWFGAPECCTLQVARSKAEWQTLLEDRLRRAQAELAVASVARDSSQFDVLLSSHSGTFFVYDMWRSLVSKLRGQRLRTTDHSDKFAAKESH
ncbi:MAG: lysophospholipid acyltransferase family protein [Pirellulaceae bacterium]